MAWDKMKSMELDDEDKLDAPMPYPMPNKPDFPYGLCICLTDKELAKLDLDHDCEHGDTIRLYIEARVTSKNCSDNESGHSCRVELQIEQMALDE